jgi:aminopeptidase N
MKKLIILFVLTLFLFSACEQQKQQESFQIEEGVSKSLNDSRKQSIGNILYTLILNVSEGRDKTIKGGMQIDFQLKKNESPLVLDFKASEKNILQVLVNGKKGEYHFEKGHIVLPSALLKLGNNQIKIDFNVNDKALNRNDEFLYSSFPPDKASTVFPCFDQPNLKALFLLNLILPPTWTAISNAPVRQFDEGAERSLCQFESTKPISTYLFSFAAGNFEKITKEKNGRKLNLYISKTEAGRLSENEAYLFDLQFNALEWMEAYTQIAYPFQKYDLLLLPINPKGNTSQPGLVYYQADDLLIDGKANTSQDLKRAKLIASKTAQMWFGNLLSPNWYNDFWLAEMLTDYLSSRMVNPSFVSVYHDLEFLTNHFPKALAIDRTSGNHSIQQECNNQSDADFLIDPLTSHKSPILFRQLEKIIGEEKMRAGLIDYLKKYSFSNAGWDDLVAALDSKTHDDLQSWCDIWFKETGMPEYKAFQEFDLYVINQYDQNLNNVIWPQRLFLYKKWSGGWQNKEVWDDKQRFEFPIQQVDIVILNWEGYAYGYFFLNNREKNFLLSKRMFELDPMRRGVSYISLWENLLRDNLLPIEMRRSLAIFLEKEKQIENINLLLSYYEQMFWRYSNLQQREEWAGKMESLLWEKMRNAQNTKEKYAFYKTFVNTAISGDGIDKMLALWRDEIKIPDLKLTERDKVSLAYELAVRKGLTAAENVPEDILDQQKQLTKNTGLLAELDFVSPALSINEGVRNSFFESLKIPKNQTEGDFVIEAIHYLHHPLRAQSAEKFILPSLEMLNEIRETGVLRYPDRWLAATFYGHRSATVVETTNNFIAAHPDLNPKLKDKVLQALDPVQRAVTLEVELEIVE